MPKPGVESAVVVFRKLHAETDPEKLRSFLQKCFAQRRKTIANNLKPFCGSTTVKALEAIGVAPTARAQQLTPEQLVKLGELLDGAKR